MNELESILARASVPALARRGLAEAFHRFHWWSVVDILVVVDTEIGTDPGNGFGIQRVIELIRGTTVGCMSFRVDIALRSTLPSSIVTAPGPFEAKYTGFRFDMPGAGGATPVIQQYQQIWCFGFKPGNDAGPDANITQPGAFPATDAELAALATWMSTNKGGLFATGDHDYLGASMCHRIPRIRTMRRWTNATGVPPIDTPDRIDTCRPSSFPPPLANSPHQADEQPQPIQWVAWMYAHTSWFKWKGRPHPVLCHPELGPIDVMPDHAHEGLCFDDADVVLTGTYDFDGSGSKPEYPTNAPGTQVRPRVIAYGSTLGQPPETFEKLDQPARPKFPMISVYDGHLASVGRVATDSTWHHWMNVNIDTIVANGGAYWEKIKRYYINLAVWLSPPGYTTKCILHWLLISEIGYAGMQEYSPTMSVLELGRAARKWLWFHFGPCWVTQFVFEHLSQIDIRLAIRLFERELPSVDPKRPWPPKPDPCLTCPPLELLEDAMLGGIIQATLPMANELRSALSEGAAPKWLKADTMEAPAAKGARVGLADLVEAWSRSTDQVQGLLKLLR